MSKDVFGVAYSSKKWTTDLISIIFLSVESSGNPILAIFATLLN
jgi:hypothetical protein